MNSAWKDRACFCRCVTDGNHIVKRLVEIAIELLRLLFRDIDAKFGHSLDS